MKSLKYFYSTILLMSVLLIAGCKDTTIVDEASTGKQKTITITASMPDSNNPSTRVNTEQDPNNKNILLTWKEGDKIKLYFKNKGSKKVTEGGEVVVSNISKNGKTAEFQVNIPPDITGICDFYGMHGINSEDVVTTIAFFTAPGPVSKLKDISIPIYFVKEDFNPDSPDNDVSFQHLGALQLITILNKTDSIITLEDPAFEYSGKKWFYDYEIINGEGAMPIYDLSTKLHSTFETKDNRTKNFSIEINANDNVKLAQWIFPNEVEVPDIILKAKINDAEKKTDQKLGRKAFEVGHAYHLYATWDGVNFVFSDADEVEPYKITMTTLLSVGDHIGLTIKANRNDQGDVWIDLNNNGIKDAGENVSNFDNSADYTIDSQTITIYGKVTELTCSSNLLTELDVKNRALSLLDCQTNQIEKLDVRWSANLIDLNCDNNLLEELDVTKNTELLTLSCSDNLLEELNVTMNTKLTLLQCSINSLKDLDVSKNTELSELNCQSNQLSMLDLTMNKKLVELVCYQNQIKSTEMEALIASLPVCNDLQRGTIIIFGEPDKEGNVCKQDQVVKAIGKNWDVLDINGDDYPGS